MKKILVVEDNKTSMKVYENYLSWIGGFKMYRASSVKETEQNYSREKFDCAILDGLEGACFGLYPQIKADKKIIITGDTDIFEKCKSENIASHLKPICINELEDLLK